MPLSDHAVLAIAWADTAINGDTKVNTEGRTWAAPSSCN